MGEVEINTSYIEDIRVLSQLFPSRYSPVGLTPTSAWPLSLIFWDAASHPFIVEASSSSPYATLRAVSQSVLRPPKSLAELATWFGTFSLEMLFSLKIPAHRM